MAGWQALSLLQVFALFTRPPPSSRPIDKLPRHSGRLALAGWLDNRLVGWSIKIPTALLLTCAACGNTRGWKLERAIPSFLSCLSLLLIDFDGPRQVPALSVTECGDHPMETRETNQAATSSSTTLPFLSLPRNTFDRNCDLGPINTPPPPIRTHATCVIVGAVSVDANTEGLARTSTYALAPSSHQLSVL